MSKYAQSGREEETYVASYVCTGCKGTWHGAVTRDRGRSSVWPIPFSFCPICGVKFEGEIPRTEASERRRELSNEAGWKNHTLTEARKITYVVETWAEFRPQWKAETHWRLLPADSPRAAVAAWKDRLAWGSMFGEDVRLVARTPRGIKVVLGPVRLEANTWKEDR